MLVVRGRNVNHTLPVTIMHLRERGRLQKSRAGDTLEYPEPVCTVYERPQERVLFDATRDSNPFFTLFEALWILGGRRDVAFLAQFNKRMAEYSDDGQVFAAAYGHRLRHATWQDDVEYCQISTVIRMLKENHDTRRAVLQIWEHSLDLDVDSVDVPCNDLIFLKIRDGRLNISVANRSNDLIWGLAGTNAVQFSIIQEYIANKVGVEIGEYRQVSDSCHVYVNEQWARLKDMPVVVDDLYERTVGYRVEPFPLFADDPNWDDDNRMFLDDPFGDTDYSTPFFDNVVQPMAITWAVFKNEGAAAAVKAAEGIAECDWAAACRAWLSRRVK